MLQMMKIHCWLMPEGKVNLNRSWKTSNYKEDVSSPISDQILEFCDPEFFQETLQNSEVTSSSYYSYENSSYTNNLTLPPDIDKSDYFQDNKGNHNSTTPATTTTTSTAATTANTNNINNSNTSNLSIIYDSQDELVNELSASIDFSPSPTFSVPQFFSTQNDHFDFSSVQPQLTLTDLVSADGLSQYNTDPAAPIMGHPLPSVFEEDCLSSVPSYVPLNPSSPTCSFLGPSMSTYMLAGAMNAALSADGSGIFDGRVLTASEMDYQGDNGGIYCPDSLQHVFNPGDLQALGNETPKLVGGPVSSAPLTSEISSLEDSTFKVGKLSVEQRKEKIHRYMKKRNERNFSKKIKYACRKTLADSRPRVRGRFAKNDDFGDIHRTVCGHHEDDEYEEPVMKEEDVMDSNIFAHISGVNSFKCNYSIQSWI
ncbi:hypothetical protein OIU84_028361 [Salix udensis]|uniref:CCT domain-containing protein n=1 Tax=Salix udensis TaxID=889485 RepID=A0AAD6KCL5_9ROSI|nr:hypothetical protein OIU84_028361 [Salix udensis]